MPVMKLWYKQMTFLSTVKKKRLEQDPEKIYPGKRRRQRSRVARALEI